MSTIQQLLSRGAVEVFRRVSIKRKQITGSYESDWYDISHYVVKYPTIRKSFGDTVILGDYDIPGFDLILDNSGRRFNREDQYTSLFYGFATRRLTMFKFELGLIGDDNSEVAGFVYHGILFDDPKNSDDGTITIPIANVLKVFEFQVLSRDVAGTNTPYIAVTAATTAEMIQRIYDMQINGEYVFHKYFTGSSINPGGDTCMSISSPVINADETAWKKIQDYSNYQDFIPYVDSDGKFCWKTKASTGSTSWYFNGGAYGNNNDYGINIVSIEEEDGIIDFYPSASIEYTKQSDNTKLFASASTSWTPGDNSDPDRYGDRVYSRKADELTAAEAAAFAGRIKTNNNTIKGRWTVESIVADIDLKDQVEITYLGYFSHDDDEAWLVGVSKFPVTLGDYLGAVYIKQELAKVIEIELDMENVSAKYLLKEAA